MKLIIRYLVLIVNPMGRILVRWKRFKNDLEIQCHPICNRLYVCYHLDFYMYEKEPYKREDILQKRPIILRSLLIVAIPYHLYFYMYGHLVRASRATPHLFSFVTGLMAEGCMHIGYMYICTNVYAHQCTWSLCIYISVCAHACIQCMRVLSP